MKEVYIDTQFFETRMMVLEYPTSDTERSFTSPAKWVTYERETPAYAVGNIYKGTVTKVISGMQSAFVDIGKEKAGFIHISELVQDNVNPRNMEIIKAIWGKDEPKQQPTLQDVIAAATAQQQLMPRRFDFPSINEILKEGDEIIVQIMRAPVGTKGPRLTTSITIPGKHVVLIPNSEYTNISRKIKSPILREMFIKYIIQLIKDYQIKVSNPSKHGLIIRSICDITETDIDDELQQAQDNNDNSGFDNSVSDCEIDAGVVNSNNLDPEVEQELKTLIQDDYVTLCETWKELENAFIVAPTGTLIYSELDLAKRIYRDIIGKEECVIVVDSEQVFNSITKIISAYNHNGNVSVKLVESSENLFQKFRLEAEVDKVLNNKIWLNSGGYLIVEQMEALTAIDVNSGKFIGSNNNFAETILSINIEAAYEIARLLMFMNISGIIIVDFIDMATQEDKDSVVNLLKKLVEKDHTKCLVVDITPIGLVEITRKRSSEPLMQKLTTQCPYCKGKGFIKSTEMIANDIARKVVSKLKSNASKVSVTAHPDVANILSTYIEGFSKISSDTELEFIGVKSLHRESYNIDTLL